MKGQIHTTKTISKKLDIDKMKEACLCLIGEHNFKSFCNDSKKLFIAKKILENVKLETIILFQMLEELQDDNEIPKCRGDDDGGLIDDDIWWFYYGPGSDDWEE